MKRISSRCLGVIPARYQSSRLESKVLADLGGKTVLQRVFEQCCKAACFDKLVIACDDQRIRDTAASFGAQVVMTSIHHKSGTDRVAEVHRLLVNQNETFDCIVNIQADMPFIRPELIDVAVKGFQKVECGMGTVASPLQNLSEFEDPSVVKVVCSVQSQALYFSRSPIPFGANSERREDGQHTYGLRHFGLYLYRPESLQDVTSQAPVELELCERLEQLRALANGIKIHVEIVSGELVEPAIEINTPQDLERARAFVRGVG